MNRVYNFSAGPSMLPLQVLEKAQKELVNYNNSGMSVMELSHRSGWFTDIITEAEQLLRELMGIPENYKVLFLQGGASQQFAAIPMNLFGENKKADYVNTGSWSKKAIKEAEKFGDIRVIASSEDKNFTYIPAVNKGMIDPEAAYVHITTNNTIEGTVFREVPDIGNVPLVADMSSNILSEEIDVSKFGLIYAGAQKNIGPAGLTVVIIREDLIGKAQDNCPTMLDFETHSESGSLYNTPPTFAIYMAKLVFEWIKELGGLKEIEKVNREKADILYRCIEESNMFTSPVEKSSRSIMNIPFVTPSKELDALFVKEAKEAGLETLKGHRSVGGMRASIYNAMPVEGVQALVEFMKKFEQKHQ
ncbi:3-phosphoserine/phosphohydroxythreonine transaminase [Bacilli bacterium]|uniref:Phosphoserine aminotransferase n=1 Tax=Oceanobacillus caeni TaxID=405946 RepID=A0ABR5MIG2_9BACI|nr:3-phosphoserine/phosphohydroxythreonine transaminase [Oceanobacillus caeni]KKE77638.1 MFS transporter [Bacilli bacterium VT-13-104]PZD83879.1 3-phosphoserine/phosphohydroxythreonine transaminase [Bacilli bacterium]KPH74316.1 MFS transporter [Oceanobacillus caeni]PZD84970.1 3-phosphoserine/phosphohydroxythreonine transaminase [Bacilli bacterium]PZD87567.1 3-phosphoserine/phosphohydroxythreonine transaminase [Bacilli bacterium]